MDSAGRIALITGCSSGFGLLTAVTLAQRGFTVVASMRNLQKRGKLDEAMNQVGAQFDLLPLDMASPESIENCAQSVLEKYGRVDVLVNNAGIAQAGVFEIVSMEKIRAQFEVNVFGLCHLTKLLVPGMRERGVGHVVQISSQSGLSAQPGLGIYAGSKFALEGISEAMRIELASFGVWVSLVEPGMFRTEIFDENRKVPDAMFEGPYGTFAKRLSAFVDKQIAKVKNDPQDVADLIAEIAMNKRPKLRYPIGGGIGNHMRKLPFSVRERMMTRFLFKE